jgi:hypothetical protein
LCTCVCPCALLSACECPCILDEVASALSEEVAVVVAVVGALWVVSPAAAMGVAAVELLPPPVGAAERNAEGAGEEAAAVVGGADGSEM